ncbi:MAG: hypothetical protein LBI64_06840, partial [Coriobacteriales bacterium]|jgi:CobQ-like glutamine amidotransferase family enzyme|nr:hypothetical protein [Coriobacteriales bacterium]
VTVVETCALPIFPFNAKVNGDFVHAVPLSHLPLSHAVPLPDASLCQLNIVGFKSQFSQVYGDNSTNFFCRCRRGAGLNRTSHLEGIRRQNLFATSLLGPLLILNPLFTKYLISLLAPDEEPKLAFENEIMRAYEERLKEFENPKTSGFDGKGH